jgi:hypothetical protein
VDAGHGRHQREPEGSEKHATHKQCPAREVSQHPVEAAPPDLGRRSPPGLKPRNGARLAQTPPGNTSAAAMDPATASEGIRIPASRARSKTPAQTGPTAETTANTLRTFFHPFVDRRTTIKVFG